MRIQSQCICCLLRYPSGAAGGGVSDSAAAATKRAAAPHTERSANLHPKLTQGGPVAKPAVLCHSLPDAGQPGGQPVWPAGQLPPQTWGEWPPQDSLLLVVRHKGETDVVSLFSGCRREERRQKWVKLVFTHRKYWSSRPTWIAENLQDCHLYHIPALMNV